LRVETLVRYAIGAGPSMADPFRFGAVILAAGASVRMGTPKQILAVGGKPLVVRAAEAALDSPAWPVVVVVGAHAEAIRPLLARLPVLVAENASWPEGMASSIRTGVGVLDRFSRSLDGVLLAVCDQTAFSGKVIARLLEAQQTTGRTIAAAHYGGRNGVPALFLRTHFASLGRMIGEEGARSLLNGDPERVAAVDLPDLAADLDTPEDYAALGEAR